MRLLYKSAILTGIIGAAIGVAPAVAQAPSAYNTSIRNYAYIGKTGYNANVATIRLYKSSNPAAVDGGFDSGQAVTFTNIAAQSLNAAGINSKDGYMYALEYYYGGPASQAASIYRVGANAVAERIGIIPGPTATNAGRSIIRSIVNLASATMDTAGNYWFTAYTYHAMGLNPTAANLDVFLGKLTGFNNLTAADSSTLVSPTYYKLDISDTTFQRGMTNVLKQQISMVLHGYSATDADGGWQDMDFNPANNQLYSYIGFPSTPTAALASPYPKPPMQSYLSYIDTTVSPWKIRVVNATSPTTNPNREEDGAWFDGSGNMYVAFTDGQYARVNLSTGLLDTVAQSSLPLAASNMRGDFATNTPVPQLPPGSSLPVQLITFGAKPAQSGAEVFWKTAAEEGMDHFEVERSADGRYFGSVALVQPKGSNSTYSISDVPGSSAVYYRLKMVDADGSVAYSAIVKWSGKSGEGDVAVYPSTVTDGVLRLKVPQTGATVFIYTLTGVSVRTATFSGENTHPVLPLSLPSGNYLVRIADISGAELLTVARILVP